MSYYLQESGSLVTFLSKNALQKIGFKGIFYSVLTKIRAKQILILSRHAEVEYIY